MKSTKSEIKETDFICRQCGRSDRKHNAFGLCIRCYKELWRRRQGIKPLGWKKEIPCTICGIVPSIAHGLCSRCYQKSYQPKRRAYSRKYAEKYHFGAHQEIINRRNKTGCEICGMTNEESLKRYGRNLTVHHIDGNGRTSEHPNHDVSNLMIVCRGCHNKLHNRTNRKEAS
jgi:hypothetical protein